VRVLSPSHGLAWHELEQSPHPAERLQRSGLHEEVVEVKASLLHLASESRSLLYIDSLLEANDM